ncbi:MAG TPA: hypothetical protein VKD28_11875 [Gemmatimonadales bacterium]|nr:hypothetical protein [Gemmatimonadales bacterium]
MTSRMRWLTLIGCLTFALPASARAQAQAQDKPADNMNLVREKIRADKKLLVAEQMQLTEAEAAKFWPVYEAFQADLGKLADGATKLVSYYADHYKSMTDTAASRMLKDYLALESDRAALLTSYQPKFSAVLPPLKVARYYQIENKIRAVVNYELARGIPMM